MAIVSTIAENRKGGDVVAIREEELFRTDVDEISARLHALTLVPDEVRVVESMDLWEMPDVPADPAGRFRRGTLELTGVAELILQALALDKEDERGEPTAMAGDPGEVDLWRMSPSSQRQSAIFSSPYWETEASSSTQRSGAADTQAA